jgi:hypothetical protein
MAITKEWVQDNPGASVVYAPRFGQREDGVIVRLNDSGTGAFVRYAGRGEAQLTSLSDLEPLRYRGQP